MTNKPRLYFASPLFSMAELEFNIKIVEMIQPYFEIFLPQRDGGLIRDKIEEGENHIAASMEIFSSDIDAMKKCNVLLAVLDGRTIDEGVAFEIGYSFGIGKQCFGLKTDNRVLLPSGNNPMIEQSLKKVFSNTEALITWAKSYTNNERHNSKSNRVSWNRCKNSIDNTLS